MGLGRGPAGLAAQPDPPPSALAGARRHAFQPLRLFPPGLPQAKLPSPQA